MSRFNSILLQLFIVLFFLENGYCIKKRNIDRRQSEQPAAAFKHFSEEDVSVSSNPLLNLLGPIFSEARPILMTENAERTQRWIKKDPKVYWKIDDFKIVDLYSVLLREKKSKRSGGTVGIPLKSVCIHPLFPNQFVFKTIEIHNKGPATLYLITTTYNQPQLNALREKLPLCTSMSDQSHFHWYNWELIFGLDGRLFIRYRRRTQWLIMNPTGTLHNIMGLDNKYILKEDHWYGSVSWKDPSKKKLEILMQSFGDDILDADFQNPKRAITDGTFCCRKCSSSLFVRQQLHNAMMLSKSSPVQLDYRPRKGMTGWFSRKFARKCPVDYLDEKLYKDIITYFKKRVNHLRLESISPELGFKNDLISNFLQIKPNEAALDPPITNGEIHETFGKSSWRLIQIIFNDLYGIYWNEALVFIKRFNDDNPGVYTALLKWDPKGDIPSSLAANRLVVMNKDVWFNKDDNGLSLIINPKDPITIPVVME